MYAFTLQHKRVKESNKWVRCRESLEEAIWLNKQRLSRVYRSITVSDTQLRPVIEWLAGPEWLWHISRTMDKRRMMARCHRNKWQTHEHTNFWKLAQNIGVKWTDKHRQKKVIGGYFLLDMFNLYTGKDIEWMNK